MNETTENVPPEIAEKVTTQARRLYWMEHCGRGRCPCQIDDVGAELLPEYEVIVMCSCGQQGQIYEWLYRDGQVTLTDC